jgi:hypothetical protein
MRRIALVAAILATAALAGCATPQSPGEVGTTVSPGGTVTTTPGEPLPSSTEGLPDPSVTLSSGEITVTGIVREGVEEGCKLVEGYLLLGSPSPVSVGQRVRVTGRVDLTIMTTCQQGTPLLVSSVTPA